jgi:hypothetical protein
MLVDGGWEVPHQTTAASCMTNAALPQALLSNALRSSIHARHEIPHRLDGLVAQPYLTTANEMHHRCDDFLIVLSDFAYGLDHIKKCQLTGFSHGNGLLCHGFTMMGRHVRRYLQRMSK